MRTQQIRKSFHKSSIFITDATIQLKLRKYKIKYYWFPSKFIAIYEKLFPALSWCVWYMLLCRCTHLCEYIWRLEVNAGGHSQVPLHVLFCFCFKWKRKRQRKTDKKRVSVCMYTCVHMHAYVCHGLYVEVMRFLPFTLWTNSVALKPLLLLFWKRLLLYNPGWLGILYVT